VIAPLVRGFQSIEDPRTAGPVGAIVVLGGGSDHMKVRSELLAYPHRSTTLRVLEAARLFRLFDGRPIVVASGGKSSEDIPNTEAQVIADALSRLGVPNDHIDLEEKSLTTHDQAIYVTSLLNSRGIGRFVVVTSPTHIWRSIAVFRAQHADVVPSVAALETELRADRSSYLPDPASFEITDAAVYDYVGLVYYWARGWLRPIPPENAE
jgi:uncharacterized SAM-binding protein YcdF (DUF218 family)